MHLQTSTALSQANPLWFAPAYQGLFKPCRYKVFYGGRGSAKSWSLARALILFSNTWNLRILCVREFQNSISDSVHRLISDMIFKLGLKDRFKITDKSITNLFTGSEFIFKGIRLHAQEIKSMEGVDICWFEEAQKGSKDSWDILRPTIRKEDTPLFGGPNLSEIWVSFNPEFPDDPTYVEMVQNAAPWWVVEKVNYTENPWFNKALELERAHMERTDPEAYDWVWGGNFKKISNAIIFGKRVTYDAFEAPPGTRFYFGMDFGFANDPSALIRFYIANNTLFIDYEAFGWSVEIDDLPFLMAGGTDSTGTEWPGIPEARDWPIKADNARPETISYLRRHGFSIEAAEKWPGSVEDGIAHLKGYSNIVIHDRCRHQRQEAKLYSYKVDKQTGDVLPIIVDKHNHGWDAVRYGHDQIIQARGADNQWVRLLG